MMSGELQACTIAYMLDKSVIRCVAAQANTDLHRIILKLGKVGELFVTQASLPNQTSVTFNQENNDSLEPCSEEAVGDKGHESSPWEIMRLTIQF